jgi:hypothetical protein
LSQYGAKNLLFDRETKAASGLRYRIALLAAWVE